MAKIFTVDCNVPMPDAYRPHGNYCYPWEDMAAGDSFFVPGGRSSISDKRDGVTKQINAAGAKKKYPGTAWTIRAVTENGVNGVRVWRVK